MRYGEGMGGMGDAKFVGVDWAKGGWFSIAYDTDGNWEAHHGPFAAIVERYREAVLILVDVPIGIPNGHVEGRVCDRLARKKISSRRPAFRSSVFRVPTRDALADRMINGLQREEAHQIERQRTGKPGITRQSWGIIPQIAEVDMLLAKLDEKRKNIREVHPEVCFWALNGKKALHHKKNQTEGESERIRILGAKPIEPRTREILAASLKEYHAKVAPDDVLDSLAAAVTARLGYPDKLATLPENPPTDARGLPMEMVFYNPRHA